MTTCQTMPDLTNACQRFEELRQRVNDHPEDAGLLDAFFNHAVEVGQISAARSAFERLQRQHQWNHQIRRLFIALCLHQGDYSAAMGAIETLLAFSQSDEGLISSALSVRKRLGPLNLVNRPQDRESISLCMIVRNDQGFLGPCLHAVKNLVDEIILVDTGSTDRTADIGRIYGAKVYDFKWCDDFSAARNSSLDKASGDWILVLDADEIISKSDHSALRKLIGDADQNSNAFSLRTRNYSNLANAMDWQANGREYPDQEAGMGWFPTDKVRLFRRSEKIRFVYPVHELVEPCIRAAGMVIVPCDIPIHHYGHINEAKNTQKARRYFELGYAKIVHFSRDPAALRELAVQAGQLERWTESIELWERLLELTPRFDQAHANMAGAYWQMGEYDKGLASAQKAIDIDPTLKEGHYNLAANMVMSGRVDEAINVLMDLVDKHPEYLAAEFMLGSALIINGEFHKGRRILKSLEQELSGQVLKIALDDLMEKLKINGLEDCACQLANAASVDKIDCSGRIM